MAVPKRRKSQSRTRQRRNHNGLTTPPLSVDQKTKSVHLAHHVDLKTGFYRGRQVLFRDDESGE